MSIERKEMAAGRWAQLSFLERMANIGSEIERALNWTARNNAAYAQKAANRALELVDLTLDSAETFPQKKNRPLA